jgi:hypothetical protein
MLAFARFSLLYADPILPPNGAPASAIHAPNSAFHRPVIEARGASL